MDAIKVCDLFDLTHTRAAKMLAACEYPWEALSKIGETVLAIGQGLDLSDYDHPAEDVWIAKTATVAATASIAGPCVIGEKTEVRPGAFIRGNVLVGDGAVVGNSCELKNCILFDEVQTPHYNYVGDSVLGYKAHMGAGAVTSNVKGDKKNVVVHGERDYETGRLQQRAQSRHDHRQEFAGLSALQRARRGQGAAYRQGRARRVCQGLNEKTGCIEQPVFLYRGRKRRTAQAAWFALYSSSAVAS